MTSISGSSSGYSGYASVQGAYGNRPPPPKPPDFSKVDSDGDGSVSKAELQEMLSSITAAESGSGAQTDAVFSKLDTDGDGSISKSEFTAASPKPPDQDMSGSLGAMGMSTQAFAGMMAPPPPPPPSLSDLDSDDDGSISATEFGLSSTSTDSTDSTSSTSSTDTDSSTDEAQLQELFNQIDTDGDGSLSSDEVSDFESAMQAAHGPQGMPPPPPPPEDDDTSTSDTLQQLLSALTSSDDSSASSDTTDFESKMKDVLAQLQSYASQQYQTVSTTVTSSVTSTVSLLA